MPRSGGVYSLPSGSLVTNGQTSDATDLNTPLLDLQTDANTARPIVAGGTGATTEAAARLAFSVPYSTTRATFVSTAASLGAPNGYVVWADGIAYERDNTATAISDLQGWKPVPPVMVTHFAGDVSSGDWGPAFEAAMTYSKVVHVPTGNFEIKSQTAFQQEGQALIGVAGPRPNAVQSSSGARLVYHTDLGSTPMLHMQYSGHVANLAFDGPAKGTGVAIIARKPTGLGAAYEDTDVDISNCSFDSWHTAVQHWNRGLRFTNNNVSLCTRGVEIEGFDDANFVDDPANPFDALAQGFRSILVSDNRIHAVDVGVRNEGLNKGSLRGFKMSGNIIDIGDALFNGGLKSGIISDNTVDQTSATPVIQFSTAVSEVVISGNEIRGDLVQGIPSRFIDFILGCERLVMTGNTLRGAANFGVYLAAGVLSGVITGNVIDLENDGDATDACIRADTDADFTDLAITGNYLNAASGSPLIRGSTTSVFTGVVIEGNAGNRSRTLVSNFVDGGDNITQSW